MGIGGASFIQSHVHKVHFPTRGQYKSWTEAERMSEDLMDMNRTESAESMEGPTKAATITAGVLMVIFLIPGILGNTWLIILLLGRRNLRQNIINLFIASLCLNDLINLTFVQTQVTSTYLNSGYLQGRASFLCSFIPEFSMISIGVSLWHHALIALHRYLAVVHWVFYRGMNKQLYKTIVIIGTRVAPLLISLCFMIYTIISRLELNREKNVIEIVQDSFFSITKYEPFLLRCIYESKEKMRILIIVISTFAIPCLTVFVCFTLVFVHVRQNARMQRRRRAVRAGSVTKQTEVADTEATSQLIKGAVPAECQETEIETDNPARNEKQRNGSFNKSLVAKNDKFDKKRLARELSITAMFGVVFIMFLIGYAPYFFARMFDTGKDGVRKISANSYVMMSVLYGGASCVNPIIFGLMNRDLRKESENMIKSFQKR
ncbi:hypothetical protein Ciccas_011016 [Cichlidogyrus casuarinus]|uniref:G-protein coupled receptors family 1 profile domain-containing protein n=1 Tax=Cichlidogyrus casuarinus TaxID=1844966 RepID=A0ABD2PT98_9PLAT